MKAFYRYRSDNGEEWIVLRDESKNEPYADTISPSGHEAVTVRKEEPVDQCLIVLRPATRITDEVKKQVSFKDRYYLVINDHHEQEELVSKEMYTWDEVVDLAKVFRSSSFEKAKKIWKIKRL